MRAAALTTVLCCAAWTTFAQHPNLAGTWTLNPTLSDNPGQISRALRLDAGLMSEFELLGPDVQGRGGEREGAGRGNGRFGRGPSDRDRRRGPQINAEDRTRLLELINGVQFAPTTLTITQAEDVTLAAGSRAPDTLHPIGKPEVHTLDAGPVNRTARWEGPLLIVSYEVGRTGTLVYTYTLVPATRHLVIRVTFERERDWPGPFEVKLVYDGK